tara:strand:- start:424 stop:609 length:186 start_codon:yes stop_codon:yes gene_type:complete
MNMEQLSFERVKVSIGKINEYESIYNSKKFEIINDIFDILREKYSIEIDIKNNTLNKRINE